jgi:hypothetical protein
MSNQWKAVFVNDFFAYKVSREVMAKFRQNPDLCREVRSVQIFRYSATRPFSDSRKS